MNQAAKQNINVQKIVVIVSMLLLALKFYAWWITDSLAVFTDAMESIVNVIAAIIGLFSLYFSAKPRDADHPYGHGKVEFLTSALEGTFVLIAGLLIIYKAITSLFIPHTLSSIDLGLIIVAVSGFVNYVAGVICVRTGRKNHSLALISSGKHLQSDTYSTIGLIIGLILLRIFKLPWIDSAVALLFSLIICYTGYKILRQSIAGIMDEADEILLQDLVDFANEHRKDPWIDIHNVRVIKYGPTLHVDAHMTLPWYFSLQEAHDQIEDFTTMAQANLGNSVEMFIHGDPCIPTSCRICSVQDCKVRQHPLERKVKWTVANIIPNAKHSIETSE